VGKYQFYLFDGELFPLGFMEGLIACGIGEIFGLSGEGFTLSRGSMKEGV
jgi:hypothetical protein